MLDAIPHLVPALRRPASLRLLAAAARRVLAGPAVGGAGLRAGHEQAPAPMMMSLSPGGAARLR